jgi:transposase-like protein
MLQNESVRGWMELIKNNSANIMQTLAEKRLNPDNYHLSFEAKKRLKWMYLLYYDQKGNVSRVARKAGISRQWLSRLKQVFERNNKDPRSLEPESKAPHSVENRISISKETENLIINIRDESLNSWGKKKISVVLERDYGIKVNPNTVNKYLHRHKRISPKLSLKNIKAFDNKKIRDSENLLLRVKFRPPKIIKDYAPGALIEKDMKYIDKPKQKYVGKHKENFWYQFTEEDSFTRIRALEVSDEQDTKTAIALHKEAKKKFPFKIACENTDNGFENNNDFSKELKKEMVFHFYSNTSTPTDNPRVERSHLTDDVEFYSQGKNTSDNLRGQKENTKKWEETYNFKRPHQALGYLTPMQFYALWKKHPEKAYDIVEEWQKYLRKQRIRLATSRRIKKKEQIRNLMKFIDAKLTQKKDDVQKAKLQLIDCQLCSVA